MSTNPEDIKQMWKDHFQYLLNNQGSLNQVFANEEESVTEEIGPAEEEREHKDRFSRSEIEFIVKKKMKNGKAAGVDEIVVEMIKAAGAIGIDWLSRVIQAAWKDKRIPEDWTKGIIVPIYKKGNRKLCRNYRGVTIMSQGAKIYEKCINIIIYIEFMRLNS